MGDHHSDLDHWQLGHAYDQMLEQLAAIEEETERRRAQDRHLVKPSDWEWVNPEQMIGMKPKKGAHKDVRLVAADLGFNVHNFHVFIAEVPPGGTEGAYHRHGEALKIYLEGQAVEIIDGKEYQVGVGDVVSIPADIWHGTQNPYDKPMRFLAVAHTASGAPLVRQPVFRIRDDLRVKDDTRPRADRSAPPTSETHSFQLAGMRSRLMQDLGVLEEQMAKLREQNRHVMPYDELEWMDLSELAELGGSPAGTAAGRMAKAVYPELGFAAHNFMASFVEIQPGEGQTPLRMHGEEVRYYLQGRGRAIVGDKAYEVEKGDVLFVPANTWNATASTSDEPLTYFSATQGRGMPVAVPTLYQTQAGG